MDLMGGEHTRHRVLFPAPSPETGLEMGQALFRLRGTQNLFSQRSAWAHSATREARMLPTGRRLSPGGMIVVFAKTTTPVMEE